MSHSQFHCTGRAYLDMHGLIFETSICYWQDQPGRGKREHTEPGVAGARGAGDAAGPTPTARKGGEANTRARPTAHARDHEGARRTATAAAQRGGTRVGASPHLFPPPTHATSAAHNLGGPRAGPRAPGSRSEAGRHVPARSRSLARADGGGGARAEARTPPFPARPPGAGRCGHGGRSTTAGRGPDDPRSGERAGAGHGTAGGQTAAPPSPNTQRRRQTGGGGGGSRSGAAAGSGSETDRDAARGSADATDEASGRTGERADEARLARPPTRRRGDDVTEAVAGGGGRAPPRGGPGGRA